jgi:hypothetical protein
MRFDENIRLATVRPSLDLHGGSVDCTAACGRQMRKEVSKSGQLAPEQHCASSAALLSYCLAGSSFEPCHTSAPSLTCSRICPATNTSCVGITGHQHELGPLCLLQTDVKSVDTPAATRFDPGPGQLLITVQNYPARSKLSRLSAAWHTLAGAPQVNVQALWSSMPAPKLRTSAKRNCPDLKPVVAVCSSAAACIRSVGGGL